MVDAARRLHFLPACIWCESPRPNCTVRFVRSRSYAKEFFLRLEHESSAMLQGRYVPLLQFKGARWGLRAALLGWGSVDRKQARMWLAPQLLRLRRKVQRRVHGMQ